MEAMKMRVKRMAAAGLVTLFMTTGIQGTEAASTTKQSTANFQKKIDELNKQNAALRVKVNTLTKNNAKLAKDKERLFKQSKQLFAKVNRFVETDTSYYHDGVPLPLLSQNGASPKSYIIDNVLYGPVESVGYELLGGSKPVAWYKQKNAVYFGIEPQGENVPLSALGNYVDIDFVTVFHENKFGELDFPKNDKLIKPVNRVEGDGGGIIVYDLNSSYSLLRGMAAIPTTGSSSQTNDAVVRFLHVAQDGTVIKELKSQSLSLLGDPQKLEIDVKGVKYLKIVFEGERSYFYNVNLDQMAP